MVYWNMSNATYSGADFHNATLHGNESVATTTALPSVPADVSDMWANASSNVSCSLQPHMWLEAKFFLISVCGTIVATFGIFGNMSTALILTRPSMRTPNNLYLTALAVFDTCLLVTAFLIYAMEYIIEYNQAFALFVAWLTYLRFCFALSHISQTGSVYITVAVTIERTIAVVMPRQSRRACTKHGAALTILCVTSFAIIFNCTKFFELEVLRKDNDTCEGDFGAYLLEPGPLAKKELYMKVYSLWLSNIIMVFLPFILLLVFNSIIAWTIRSSIRRLRWGERIARHSELKQKSRDATRVLFVIVFIFLVCNFWGFVLTLLEHVVGRQRLQADYLKFYAFSREAINFLAIVNSSINFVIYCIFGKDFRKELVVVYGCGIRGISIKLPVHDKFATWRSGGKRASHGRGGSTPNLANVGMKQFSEAFGAFGGAARKTLAPPSEQNGLRCLARSPASSEHTPCRPFDLHADSIDAIDAQAEIIMV